MNFSKSDLLLVSCFWNIVCIYVNEYMWKYHQICFNLQQYSYCFEIIFKKQQKIFQENMFFQKGDKRFAGFLLDEQKGTRKKNYNKQRETKLTATTTHRPTTLLNTRTTPVVVHHEILLPTGIALYLPCKGVPPDQAAATCSEMFFDSFPSINSTKNRS